jgi:hypothetical protein
MQRENQEVVWESQTLNCPRRSDFHSEFRTEQVSRSDIRDFLIAIYSRNEIGGGMRVKERLHLLITFPLEFEIEDEGGMSTHCTENDCEMEGRLLPESEVVFVL